MFIFFFQQSTALLGALCEFLFNVLLSQLMFFIYSIILLYPIGHKTDMPNIRYISNKKNKKLLRKNSSRGSSIKEGITTKLILLKQWP